MGEFEDIRAQSHNWSVTKQGVGSNAVTPDMLVSVAAPVWYAPTGGSSLAQLQAIRDTDADGRPITEPDGTTRTKYRLAAVSAFVPVEERAKRATTVAFITSGGIFNPNGGKIPRYDPTLRDLLSRISEDQALYGEIS